MWGCSKRCFNVITCEGLLQVFSKVLIVRQYYLQGGVRLFIRTRGFGFANGATGLVHDEKDVAERVTIAKEGVFQEFKFRLQVLRRT